MWLLLAVLSRLLAPAHALAPNAAHMSLGSQIHMALATSQTGGGCWPGYHWHTGYGGCRKPYQEQRSETQACPSGTTGQQTRLHVRQAYAQQGTSQVAYDAWVSGPWDSSTCTPVATLPTILETRIQESRTVDVAHGTGFGAGATYYAYLMLHTKTGLLWCYAAIDPSESIRSLQEYPAAGRFYADASQLNQVTECRITGEKAAFGGSDTGYGIITRTATLGCTHRFTRTGFQVPYPTVFVDTVNTC